jgi:hypothetical protein
MDDGMRDLVVWLWSAIPLYKEAELKADLESEGLIDLLWEALSPPQDPQGQL